MHPIQRFVRDYEWIHTGIGLVGNLLFLIGSVFFLWETTKAVGVWLFIFGAGFMLLGSIGRAVVDWERHAMGRSRQGSS
jgi:hypothetical protein